ncbi:MAG: hypothetical protein KAK00_08610 [Nanoarchaeota archaeon]|nr:hypothetical protein [Nanoarchaeota archaeon]
MEKKIAWVVESPHDLFGVSREIIEQGNEFKPDQIKSGVGLNGNNYGLLTGELKLGDELHIICFKDGCAIAPDAINEHRKEVNSGYRAVFRVADIPLRQVKIE